jgi:hypothetical protein
MRRCVNMPTEGKCKPQRGSMFIAPRAKFKLRVEVRNPKICPKCGKHWKAMMPRDPDPTMCQDCGVELIDEDIRREPVQGGNEE